MSSNRGKGASGKKSSGSRGAKPASGRSTKSAGGSANSRNDSVSRAIKKAAKAAKSARRASAPKLKPLVYLLVFAAAFVFAYIYDTQSYALSDFFGDVIYRELFPKQASVPGGALLSEGELKIHFVDVGQGDSAIVQFPDGKHMVIDGGPRSSRYALESYVRHLSVTHFDYVMLTHTDEDHCGGLAYLLEDSKITFGQIFMPDITPEQVSTVIYRRFYQAAEALAAKGTVITHSHSLTDIETDAYIFDIITPLADEYASLNHKSSEQLNAISPIALLNFGNRSIMFTGDANERSESNFLNVVSAGSMPQSYYSADVLKVGHHGSKSSTMPEFLNAVTPGHAVISYGQNNKYGHPAPEVLVRLETYMPLQNIYGTGAQGSIVLAVGDTDGDGDFELNFTVSNPDAAVISVKLERFYVLEAGASRRGRYMLQITVSAGK